METLHVAGKVIYTENFNLTIIILKFPIFGIDNLGEACPIYKDYEEYEYVGTDCNGEHYYQLI